MSNEANADIVLEGAAGIYRRVDLKTGWGETRILISFDSDLDSLGFTFVGDLVCSAMALGILRCYVHPVESTIALVLVGIKDGTLNVVGVFFDVRFADGASLTTTTSRAVQEKLERGLHKKVYPWKGAFDLYHRHQAHINELKPEHGEVLPVEATLLSVAQSIDLASISAG
jgi:hypothetical protein